VQTGKLVKVPDTFGPSFTNNSFAISPDGHSVYVTLIPKSKRWRSLLLERIAASDGKQTFIANGEQPAISPNGQMLAYVMGDRAGPRIAVRDLASGRTRSINVARFFSERTDVLGASIAWVGDDSDIAVVPGPVLTALGATRTRSGPSAGRGDAAVASPTCLMAFDPLARRLLYLVGHSPPALWRATIAGGRLVGRHLLIRNSQLGPVAW
jgi:WD40-like Beta Propeller Repeat